jgi:H+-translocating NAD(P) transhydrogenase
LKIIQNLSRVALSPAVTAALVKKGFNVNIEKGAGVEAKFRDEDYLAAGGKIVDGNKAFDSGENT